MTEPPAERLRTAADLLERTAAEATTGPWEPEYAYGNRARVQAVFIECGAGADCEEHHDCYDGTRGIGGFDRDGDNRWTILASPPLAGPLAAWLRAEADRLDAHVGHLETYRPDPVVDFGDEQRSPWTPGELAENVAHHWRHELAVAEVILGACSE